MNTNYIIILGLIIGFFVLKQLSRTQPELSSEVAKSYLKDDNYRFLDVRTESEFLSGHIENSIHIPLQELLSRLDEIEQLKQKDIIVYCRSGARSGKAINILIKNNFKDYKDIYENSLSNKMN